MSYLLVKEQGEQLFVLVQVLKIAARPYNCTIFKLSEVIKLPVIVDVSNYIPIELHKTTPTATEHSTSCKIADIENQWPSRWLK